jgi:hypothetical protein
MSLYPEFPLVGRKGTQGNHMCGGIEARPGEELGRKVKSLS